MTKAVKVTNHTLQFQQQDTEEMLKNNRKNK